MTISPVPPRRAARAAIALGALALCAAAHAQTPAKPTPKVPPSSDLDASSILGVEPTGPSQPTPRGLDGHPDLTGYWKPIRTRGKPGGNIGKDQPGFKLPFTPAGEAALQYNLTKTVDPEAVCILGGIPRHNASGLPFEILHTPQRLATLYVYNTHRWVWIDGRQPDPEADPRYFGNAVAHWEGDTLVIDSNGFKDSKDGKLWIDENANPQSEKTHVVERWTRPDFDHIHLEMTIDDPVYYTKPFTFSRTWVHGKPGEGLTEYACNENNIDAAHIGPGPGPIGPDGNRGSGYDGKALPAVPPPPEFYDNK
ncbi:MAG: hypothetical protein J7521_19070 [Caulobacter sp.]|nr:hypothetical protein [Caulobacter sp.]